MRPIYVALLCYDKYKDNPKFTSVPEALRPTFSTKPPFINTEAFLLFFFEGILEIVKFLVYTSLVSLV